MIAALPLLLAACAPAETRQPAPLVLASASLQEALTAAAGQWMAAGNPRPVISFASTSALVRQVERGAPADLIVSADEAWMNHLAAHKLIQPRTRVSFLTNRLVLVAPEASRTAVTIGPRFPLARALGTGRLAMADPGAVPAGKYGREALTRLGVWPSVRHRIAASESVRAALLLVARGEAPLGIVYATDAQAARGVRIVGTFPASSHTPITYPVATLAGSRNPDAERFRRFLVSAEGKAIFRRFGFGTV
jgi:molybdate transport system substrate-binding protein